MRSTSMRRRWAVPVDADASGSRPAHRGAASRSRSRKRWILPVAVFGSSARNSIVRGYLYGRQALLHIRLEFVLAGRCTRLEHHEGLGLGESFGVGDADHRRLQHRRMLHQRRLDLERRDIDAADLEHVVAAAAIGAAAVAVAYVLVAAFRPGALEGVASARGCPSTSARRSAGARTGRRSRRRLPHVRRRRAARSRSRAPASRWCRSAPGRECSTGRCAASRSSRCRRRSRHRSAR